MGSKRYTDEQIVENAKDVKSMTGLLRSLELKPIGGNFNTIKRKIAKLNIDCSHWTGQLWSKGQSLKDWSNYKLNSSMKRNLLKTRGHTCEDCGLTTWKNSPIPIELHHIDGSRLNNIESNLQLLCPNCHSLTPNFRRSKSSIDNLEPKIVKKRVKLYSICQKCSKKCAYRANKCMECYNLEKAKNIPTKEQLELDLVKFNNNMCAIGRKYSVSDNAVRKWIKKFNIIT